MLLNLVGPFIVNAPFGTEIAFAKGLRRLGHEVSEVDPNVDVEMRALRNDADATLVFKSCCGAERFLKSLRHPVIVYQPDDARFPHIRQMMLMMREYADLFLGFDNHGVEVAHQMGYRSSETLLLTADDELYCPSSVPLKREIDVSFVGSLGDPVAHASRRKMIEIVQREADVRGWNTAFGSTQDIPQVLEVYRRSKVVLNHATDVGQEFGWGYGLQCRHFEVGMTRTPLLSNYSYSAIPGGLCRSFCDEQSLIERVTDMIENESDFGDIAYDVIRREHMPEHRAAQLVEFISRNS